MKIYCKNKIIKNLVVNKNKILNENNKNKPIKSLCNVVICTKKNIVYKTFDNLWINGIQQQQQNIAVKYNNIYLFIDCLFNIIFSYSFLKKAVHQSVVLCLYLLIV